MAETESIPLALLGAGGKMGQRITQQIEPDPTYDVRYVEPAKEGRETLREQGIEPISTEEAIDGAEIVILAIPDELIQDVTDEVVPKLDSGAMVVLLDPAAAYAGALHEREDITYFATHPCHPSFETAETSMSDSDPDWFGGQGRDEQDIVCALHQGPEEDYDRGEAVARDINAPVRRVHRLTTEQMALLEPALAESLAATLIDVINDGMEEITDKGVPEQAAFDFLMGHLRITIAITFGMTDFPFSDAAQEKMAEARNELLQDDWRNILTVERTKESVRDIADVD